MRLALDTNRYTDLARGNPEVARALESAEEIYLPFAVVAELRSGFALGSRGGGNERAFQRFLLRTGVSVLYPDDPTTKVYASLFRQLRLQGTPIPTNDLWIAALVMQHDLVLFSRDRRFQHLPQLQLLG